MTDLKGLENEMRKIGILLEKNLIVNLAMQNVPQQEIRKMLGCDLNKVTAIVKVLKKHTKSKAD